MEKPKIDEKLTLLADFGETEAICAEVLDNPATEGETARLPSGKLIPPTREDALEQRIGSRMRSRLYEMCRTVEVSAPDFRREKTHAGRA